MINHLIGRAGHEPFDLMAFLKRELKPTENRWRSTIRLTLACLAGTVPIMVFHLKEPVFVLLFMFLIATEDKTSTLLGSIIGMVGVTIGCGALLLFYVCAVDVVWLRVLCVPLFIGFALFVNRVVALGPLGTAIGLPMAIGMVLPEITSNTEFLNRFPFYLWWSILLGLSVNCLAHLLLNQHTSESVLTRALITRIDAVEQALRDLAAGKKVGAQDPVFHLALEGITEPLHLMALASKLEPWLRKHQAEMRAKFILVDRLVEAVALIEDQEREQFSESTKERFIAIADGCVQWRKAILERNSSGLEAEEFTVKSDGTVPSLSEMERVAGLMPKTFSEKTLPDELRNILGTKAPSVVVPDALTNREYFHYAVKGGLAGLICYLLFTSVKYEGIDTAVTTCIVCAVVTVGASTQKGVLRLTGAAVGGALGVLTLVYIFPNFDSLGGFWLPVAAVSALAAYVDFGSPRIAYCGVQIAYAFYNCVLQAYGPYTELKVVRDRLLGILLGLTVYEIINRTLWPVTALSKAEEKLAAVLGTLAKLAALPDEDEDPRPQLAAAYRLRLQIYQDLAAVRSFLESSKFEPASERRDELVEAMNRVQRLFLRLLAIVQHRADLRPYLAPERVRMASLDFRRALSAELLKQAGRRGPQNDSTAGELTAALARLEHEIKTQMPARAEDASREKAQARLELYEECTALVTG